MKIQFKKAWIQKNHMNDRGMSQAVDEWSGIIGLEKKAPST